MYSLPSILSSGTVSDLKGAADIIEEVSDTVIYFGFCKRGTATTAERGWSILKIEISGAVKPIVHTFKWADGQLAYNQIWDNRAALTYKFRTF